MGGHVAALESGVFRSDIPCRFGLVSVNLLLQNFISRMENENEKKNLEKESSKKRTLRRSIVTQPGVGVHFTSEIQCTILTTQWILYLAFIYLHTLLKPW